MWRCTKGWIQVPAWPRAADNYEWPPWAYGAGSVKLGKPKNCKFQADGLAEQVDGLKLNDATIDAVI